MHVRYACMHVQVVLVTKKLDHVWDLGALCNGILSGLVSINAGCATVLPWNAPAGGKSRRGDGAREMAPYMCCWRRLKGISRGL